MQKTLLKDQNWHLIIDSPGRINIIGEHIDYNDGLVLPTAIDKKIRLKFRINNTKNICNIYSQNFDASFQFELNKISKSKNQWENYILGVIKEIQQITSKEIKGFDCTLKSTIPIGSGVSSSAALECGIAFGLNELFNLKLDKQTLVEVSQKAEHNFVGTNCGIMDQFASVMSQKDHVILLDCQSLDFSYIPIDLKPYRILLVNSNVSHNLASGEYNIRRSQCDQGLAILRNKFPEITSFRDVSIAQLKETKTEMSTIIFNRCLYVVSEIERVFQAVEALKNNQLKTLGNLMYQTHEGLSKLYEVSCPELDFLVDFTKNNSQILGSRMMGGGFGGCTINIIHENAIDPFLQSISEAYFKEFNIKLSSFEGNPSAGTSKS